jgi:hypothetical protein
LKFNLVKRVLKRNVIFLDFDGVLATEEYTARIRSSLKYKDYFGTLFNPECVKQLSTIISETGAKIVITLDWRNYLNICLLRLMWIYRKMPGHIIGRTARNGCSRGEQIDKWLKKHSEVKAYAIIDDMNELQFHKSQTDHLVVTPHYTGLDESSVQKAIAILKSQHNG